MGTGNGHGKVLVSHERSQVTSWKGEGSRKVLAEAGILEVVALASIWICTAAPSGAGVSVLRVSGFRESPGTQVEWGRC